MKTCFGYIRVSTAKQGEGVSLEAQQQAISAFAERHDMVISEWFEEKETAAKKGRPIFNRMVADLHRGKADGLVIHKIDRSARNFTDWARIGELADAGIDIHFATESLDFRSRGGRLTADIQAVIAADYVRNLREETVKGIEGRLKQGLYPFRAPIGYVDNGGGRPKTIDPVFGPIVRGIFEQYCTGEFSHRTLCADLKRRGVVMPTGRPFSKTNIENMLRNPFYVGLIHIKRSGKTYEGIHEPMISQDLFDRAEALRLNRGRNTTTKHTHRFRGMFRCSLCDTAMICERQKGHVYLRCHTKGCDTKTVREDHVEEAVSEFLEQLTLSNETADRLRQRFAVILGDGQVENARLNAQFELTKIEERLSRLTDKLLDGVIDDGLYEKKKRVLLHDRIRAQECLSRARSADAKIARIDQFLELAKNLCRLYQNAADAGKREILNLTTSNRLVEVKKLALEPSDWLVAMLDAAKITYGPPHRASSRTLSVLSEFLERPEFARLLADPD